MMVCNQRLLFLLLTAGVSILLCGSLTACQDTLGAATGSGEPQPNSPVEASRGEAITATLTVTPTPTSTPLPTEAPPKTVEEIENTWAANDYLDGTHLALEMDCETCHNRGWPPPGSPDRKVCLACHGGSYEAIAARTIRDPNPHKVNMHNPDLDQVACSECHLVHGSLVDPCSECH